MEAAAAIDLRSDLEVIRGRARRRWLSCLAGVALASAVVGVVVPAWLGRQPRHHQAHGHTAVIVTISVCLVVMVLVVAAVVGRGVWRGDGIWAPALSGGLPRRQRQEVRRALARSEPSSDAVLRAVELEAAQRHARLGTRAAVLFVLLALTQLAEAVFAGHLFSYGTSAACLVAAGWNCYLAARARKYLSASSRVEHTTLQ